MGWCLDFVHRLDFGPEISIRVRILHSGLGVEIPTNLRSVYIWGLGRNLYLGLRSGFGLQPGTVFGP